MSRSVRLRPWQKAALERLSGSDRPDFLDLALVYALMNFIGTIAVMKFVRFSDLAGMEDETEDTF